MEKFLKDIFKNPPVLTTERLTLRKMMPSDADDMYEYASNPIVPRYLLWNTHPNVKFSHSYLKYIKTQYASGDFFDWALTLTDSGKMIGTCGFTLIDEENYAGEIGYVLNPAYWGHGIAAEAVKRVMSFGFGELRLNRIYARIMDGNKQSERVAEKCGMRHEGTLVSSLFVKGEFKTIKIYAILRDEFYSLFPKDRYIR